MRANLRVTGLDRLQRNLNNFNSKSLIEDVARELAAIVIERAQQSTPVKTGKLKAGFTGGQNANAAAFARSLIVTKTNDMYEIEIRNDVDYAAFVEYGHRTRGGGFVAGKYMLSIAVSDAETMSQSMIEQKLLQQLGGVFS